MFRIQCPKCEHPVPKEYADCPRCKKILDLESASDAATKSLTWHFQEFINNATPRQLRRFQRVFLLISLAIMWSITGYVASHEESWGDFILMSAVYLIALGLLAKWLVPRRLWVAVASKTSRIVKLALVVNYLSALLLIQVFIGTWQKQALILGGLFGASFLAAYLLCVIAWPLSMNLYHIFFETESNEVDPTRPQGRRGIND